MSEANDKTGDQTKTSAGEMTSSTPPAAAQQAPQAQQSFQVEVDDSHVSSSYSNFCRVTGSPEELIVDFGLNPQPMGIPTKPIVVNQRIILNFFTAKRLLGALQMSIQRHESVFGVLETDVQKRIQRSS
jgi:hypothetical protein